MRLMREKPPFPLGFGHDAPPEGTVFFVPGTTIYPAEKYSSGVTLHEYLFALAISTKINNLKGFYAITSAKGVACYNRYNTSIDVNARFGAYAQKAKPY